MAKAQKTNYDTPVKRLLRACGLELVRVFPDSWEVTSAAWKRLQKWEEEHGNDY